MEKRRRRRSPSDDGTILQLQIIPPHRVNVVVESLASDVINGFAHGAYAVVISARHKECAWVVSTDAAMPLSCFVAMFDPDAPLESFLATRAEENPDRASYETASAVVCELDGPVAYPRGWRCMALEPLTQVDEDEASPPETLGELGSVCAEAIARAFASGANHLRFELYPNERILIMGDDGDPEAAFRCVEGSERQLAQFLAQDISLVYGGQDPRMGAFIEERA